jgi:hypothetical protein
MTDSNPRHDGANQYLPNGELDRELDAALAKLAAVEPREGLEERILANLRTEHNRAGAHSWWRWPAVAALAVMVVAVFIALRSEKPAHDIAAYTPAITQPNKNPGTQFTNDRRSTSIRPNEISGRRPKPHESSRPASVPIAPKLDQFPSPQPLSEQERMLTAYVAEHHQQAVLIAQARMVELKQELAEEMEKSSAASNRQTSDQPASQQEDR